MNLLIIEFRAEIGFANTQAIFRTPGLFKGLEQEAELAADIIGRIRRDEEIHVYSLRLYLGELRELHIKTLDGKLLAGADIIDRFWAGLVHWATVEQPQLAAEAQYSVIRGHIRDQAGSPAMAGEIQAAFDNLIDPRCNRQFATP